MLLAASEFIVRGPVRFLRAADFNDFISPYIQSRALVRGMDPYSLKRGCSFDQSSGCLSIKGFFLGRRVTELLTLARKLISTS
jgi:hypothetical protein